MRHLTHDEILLGILIILGVLIATGHNETISDVFIAVIAAFLGHSATDRIRERRRRISPRRRQS